MAKQTFTTGQVLTSAQMTSLQQTAMGGGSTTAKTASYVLVAADAGTVVQMNSASATTITVNTALFAAGDTVQIQNVGAGVCTVTAGTATVSTSATLALKQYDAGNLYFNSTSAAIFFAVDAADGMPNVLTTTGDTIYSSSGTTAARLGIGSTGQVLTVASGIPSWATPSSGALTLISTTTFTSVAGVSVDSLFSSTYDNYVIYFNISAVGAGSTDITMKLRSSGADNSSADYTSQTSYMQNGTLYTTYATAVTTGFKVVQNIAAGSSATIQLYSPNLTTTKSGQILGQGTAEASNRMAFGSYYKPSATQFTGMSFISGINITGTLSVYGLAK